MIEGKFVLVTDAGRETVGPGTCIGFPAGTGDGHHFLNFTETDAAFLVVGDRHADDEVTYPDIDLELKAGPDSAKGFPQGWHALSANVERGGPPGPLPTKADGMRGLRGEPSDETSP